MSVEFAAEEVSSQLPDGRSFRDTEEPNQAQIKAFTQVLWPYVQERYPSMHKLGTSAEVAFRDDGSPARSGAHGDTYTWSEETLQALGIQDLHGRGEPSQEDIRECITKIEQVLSSSSGDEAKRNFLNQ